MGKVTGQSSVFSRCRLYLYVTRMYAILKHATGVTQLQYIRIETYIGYAMPC